MNPAYASQQSSTTGYAVPAPQIAAVPREPGLSAKAEQIAGRAASINATLDALDTRLEQLFGGEKPGPAHGHQNGAQPIHSIDSHLAYCSSEFALIEGRLQSILALLEHRL